MFMACEKQIYANRGNYYRVHVIEVFQLYSMKESSNKQFLIVTP